MPWRTICPDPKTFREVTLEELLAEPVVRLMMARDGVLEEHVRHVAEEARQRLGPPLPHTPAAEHAPTSGSPN